jgi:hypothetical protein
VDDDVKQKAMTNMVLIKFKIINVHYDERPERAQSLAQKLRAQLSRLLLREKTEKSFSLQPTY